jgi:hypothetical protein
MLLQDELFSRFCFPYVVWDDDSTIGCRLICLDLSTHQQTNRQIVEDAMHAWVSHKDMAPIPDHFHIFSPSSLVMLDRKIQCARCVLHVHIISNRVHY